MRRWPKASSIRAKRRGSAAIWRWLDEPHAPVADAKSQAPSIPDDEKFRLIGGFNDVFVTIGVPAARSRRCSALRASGSDRVSIPSR